jgi:hypothetical protein
MAFPDVVFLTPGDQFKTRTSTQGPIYLPGTRGIMPNGDEFRYAQMGAVAGVVGKLYQGPLPVTNHVLQTAAAAAVGATTVALTLGATAVTANDYVNGTLVVDLVGNTGFGYTYHIGAHPAVASSGVFTVPFAGSASQTIGTDGLVVAGTESVQVAIATTANSVSIYPNLYKKVLIVPGTLPTASIAGVPPVAIAASSWGWLQTKGEAMVLTDNTTVVIGQPAIASTVTSGAVSLVTTTNIITSPIVGTFTRVAVSASYSTVNLNLP